MLTQIQLNAWMAFISPFRLLQNNFILPISNITLEHLFINNFYCSDVEGAILNYFISLFLCGELTWDYDFDVHLYWLVCRVSIYVFMHVLTWNFYTIMGFSVFKFFVKVWIYFELHFSWAWSKFHYGTVTATTRIIVLKN